MVATFLIKMFVPQAKRRGMETIMKKVMRIGFYMEMVMILAMFALLIFGQQIPELLVFIFVIGMLICLISSVFVRREKNSYN